jgi:hypothetical protein
VTVFPEINRDSSCLLLPILLYSIFYGYERPLMNEFSPVTSLEPLPQHLGIVCPIANESQTIERFVTEVLAQCTGFEKVSFFAVLDKVDRDGTREILDEMAKHEARLRPVWAPENRCATDAYVKGYRVALDAGCDWILEIGPRNFYSVKVEG